LHDREGASARTKVALQASGHRQANHNKPMMKSMILCAALALTFAFTACDTRVNVPPGDSNTTVVNPPGDKKETTIVNPPKSESSTSTTTTNTPAGSSTTTTTEKK